MSVISINYCAEHGATLRDVCCERSRVTGTVEIVDEKTEAELLNKVIGTRDGS